MTFKIEWIGDVVLWNYSGTVNSNEILDSNKKVYGDARFDQLHFEVANFLDTSGIAFTEKDVRIIAAMDKAAALTNPRIKVALVANRPEIVELLHLYRDNARGGPWEVRVFDSLEAVAAWIGVTIASEVPVAP